MDYHVRVISIALPLAAEFNFAVYMCVSYSCPWNEAWYSRKFQLCLFLFFPGFPLRGKSGKARVSGKVRGKSW